MGASESKENKQTQQKLAEINYSEIRDRSIMSGQYQARVIDLYDGDTMTVALFNMDGRLESLKIRLYGVDTPELKGKTSDAGKAAKAEALRYLGACGCIGKKLGKETALFFRENPCIVCVSFVPEKEKWGRYLAHIRYGNSKVSLAEHLIATGHGNAYDGGTKDQSNFE